LGGIKLTDLSSSATGLTYTNTTGVFSATSGYAIPTTAKQTNWDTAYTQTQQWNGGSTNLVAATGRTSLGATTVGGNLFTLTNPSAVTFPRLNLDNTVSALDAATFRTAIGAGTSSTTGTVTSIATTSPITGGTITGTGTIGINASSANTASFVVQRDASGNFSAGTITATLSGNASTATSATSATSATTATNLAGGGAGQVPYNTASGATSFLAAGTSGQVLTSAGTSAPTWTNATMPSGSIMQYAGATAPTGYLLCDGSAVSRTTYSALFAVTNTTYGVGDGSTTFNLPNMQSRLPIGAGTGSGLTLRTRGTTYGTETFTLVAGNIPSLTSSNAGSHSHTPASGGSIGNSGISTANLAVSGGSQWGFSSGTITSTAPDHTHTVGSGSPSAITFLPPTLALNYIIKI
jgi:microcystin-dependent protein